MSRAAQDMRVGSNEAPNSNSLNLSSEVTLISQRINIIPQENTNNRWSCFRKIKPRTVNGLFEFPVEVEFFSVEEDEDSMEDEDSITLEILSEGGLVSLSNMSLASSEISPEIRRDIKWAQEVGTLKKRAKMCEDGVLAFDSSYTLQFESRSPDSEMWLVMKITTPIRGSWSPMSIRKSGEIWWKLFAQSFPIGKPEVEGARAVTARDFYTSAHVPDRAGIVPDAVQHPVLTCRLLPYQRRTVRWMVQREGMDLQDNSSSLVPYDQRKSEKLPSTFFEATDKEGRICYVSHVFGIVSTDLSSIHREGFNPRGGILAEEMGLGKTVELVALMMLNKMPAAEVSAGGNYTIGTTLIITPPSILDQWKSEIAAHAPGVKVFSYEGLKSCKKLTTADLVKIFTEHDVVLTTYPILSSEIHYAQPSPVRNMRALKKYAAEKSPLVEVCWWRVCLDEAQMIDGGHSNAAVLARTIPRVNAWAVTGTPIRKDVNDLHGLLRFLDYRPFCDQDKVVFSRLVQFNHAAFRSLFEAITLRHTKDMVRDEIVLPLQKRVVVTVPFSLVEEQNYRDLVEKMCSDCGVDVSGIAATGDWSPSPETLDKMRTWLTRLRQTCLHPQAGGKNRKLFGTKGPLKTVGEVLLVMIDIHENNIRNDERALFESMIRRGQLHEHLKDFESALAVWKSALKEVQGIIEECRAALAQEAMAERKEFQAEGETKDLDSFIEENESSEDEDDEEVKVGRIGALKNRLRSFLDIEHSCLFWIGTAYYNLQSNKEAKDPKSAEFKRLEVDYYNQAKLVRKEIMHETQSKALKLINNLRYKADKQEFVEVPDMDPTSTRGGIESRPHLDSIYELTEALNQQAVTVDTWREKLVQLLIKPMMDEDGNEEDKGDEFEVSVMEQELSERYMTAIRALIADREEALQGLPNHLVKHDIATDLARSGTYQNFLRELIAERDILKPRPEFKFLRAHITALRGVISNLKTRTQSGNTRVDTERAFAEAELKKVQATLTKHSKINADLAREVEMMRNVTNARKEYYRQVQYISDTLRPFDSKEVAGKSKIDESLFEKILKEEKTLTAKITKAKAASRYMTHLKCQGPQQAPICLICRDSYELGVFTSCGHEFCKSCMADWWKVSRKCPSCATALNIQEIHQVSYKPTEATMQEEQNSSSPEASRQSSPGIYADMDDRILKEIKRIDLKSYFGTKIDMMVRHLLWLKSSEPGFKAVIFSQWSDFLEFMKTVLKQAKIGYSSLEKKNGVEVFKTDPDCHCFFLHSKSQSAGLSLVNATHVFLCEPLINVSLELQAISRVHRIGQTRPTTVWLYVVNGTVEQSVLEVSTRRRLAMMEQHSVLGEEGRSPKRFRTEEAKSGEEIEFERSVKRQRVSGSNDGEKGERSELPTLRVMSPKRKCGGVSDDDGDRPEKAPSPKTPISTERQLDIANSQELQKVPGKLVEKSPGGGELVGNEDLWACLFGVGKEDLHGKEVRDSVRRELLAGAAENRAMVVVSA